ncbi:MAG: hypothetical protein CVU44_14760 [Chloroflexi bacterium HGW-Chloroflexi-6]|nr:MAG: hypothetical protein CVU44_14760 [Chloroflexi bacterium HGW-Chloroflexi-6]
MTLQTILYLLSLLITCALSAFLTVYAWRHKQVPGSSAYARLAFCETFFALAEILSVLSPSTASALFWFQVRYLFGALIGISWFIFAMEYNGHQAWLSKHLLAGLFIIPLITQILLWSNDLHGLWMQSEASFTQNGPFWIADLTTRIPSLGYLAHIFYALLLTVTGIVLLLLTAWKIRREFIVQSLMLVGAGLTTLFFVINSLFNLLPKLEFNPFTPGLGLSVLLIALAVFRFNFLKRAPKKMVEHPTNLEEPEMRSLAPLLLVFLLLASGIFTSAYFSYTNFERQFRTQVEQQLSSVAELKITELQNWRNERLGDAEALHSNPALAALVQAYLANPQDAQSAELLQAWIDGLQSAYQYDRVFLLDLEGVERMGSLHTSEPVAAHLIKDSAAVLASEQPALIDFHRNSAEGKVHLAVLVPILDKDAANRPLGVLVLRIDPELTLYPRIQQWPTASESAEALLVRRDGDAVLFLNPVRFKDDAALKLRYSLTETDVLAVQAVLGKTGIVEGIDYRGEAVLGALAPVPGTPWFLVARMDMAEVYAPLRERLWETSFFFGGLLVACGAGLLLFWRQQRMRYYQAQIETLNALHDSQAQVANVFKSAMDAIITVDEDQKVIIFNPSAEQMFGCPADEVIGQTMDRFLPEYAHKLHRKHMHFFGQSDSTKRSMKTPMLALTCLRANGEAFASDISISHIEIGGRKLYTAIIRDITERNQIENELRQSQENFARAFVSSPTALAITRRVDGKFLDLNEAYTQIMGYEPAEILGRTPAEMKIYVNQGERDNLVQQLREQGTVRDYELLVNTKSGEMRNLLVSMEPILYNKEASIISTFIDITERKLAEQKLANYSTHLEETVGQRTRELRDAQEQLVRQERLAALGQLAGSLGHELRNPLGVISNAVYFLKISQPEASPKVREYLDIIEKETRVSDKIVTDLLDFTRIKSLDRQPASVSELVDQTLERNPAPPAVEVQLEIPAGLPPVFADPQHVIQILGNLVSNAYQAMLAAKPASAEKKLKVSVTKQRDMIKIRVTDTGPGIPPENLAKLFQPLFTTKTKGIGLGLAVSQKLVEANGGKIEVESAVGKGSAFTIYLPIYEKST